MIQYSGLEMDEVHVKHRRPKRTEDLRLNKISEQQKLLYIRMLKMLVTCYCKTKYKNRISVD